MKIRAFVEHNGRKLVERSNAKDTFLKMMFKCDFEQGFIIIKKYLKSIYFN